MSVAKAAAPRHAPARTIKALIDGRWHGELAPTDTVRKALQNSSEFRHRIEADEQAEFPAVPGRYHLYVSYACPWAHRTIIYRKLKGLEDVISISVLHPRWAGPDGWRFGDSAMSTIDHVSGHQRLYEVYQAADPRYTGRVTVPVLWDKKTGTIVNNQSGDIIRMLNSVFDHWADADVDFYPEDLRPEIDRLNAWLLPNICGAVYRAGFARHQSVYDDAINVLFGSLDQMERRLRDRSFLHGERITESDWHLFATLCRFDAVYHGALKCNLRRLGEYPALTAFTARIQATTGIGDTVRIDHMKHHYYDAIGQIEPTIVPRGPEVEYLKDVGKSPKQQNLVPVTLSLPDFIGEIRDLHRYLGQWLRGEIIEDPRGPTRLRDVLADDFTVVHPNGRREGKADVVQNFARAYGEKPAGYSLDIDDIVVEELPGEFCFATYRETHRGEVGRARVSSALLRHRDGTGDIEWLYLQETFITEH